ncbi:hypothetical protein [Alkalicoccus daliensis]|uniref:Uncharacterized protein n=1 Tax=Alkalicoccus daliensis TaxID=745820 RepID=A0A1H0CTJ9_9BACI|nr:hypothetical protein [Alkalicoccus daliensis]SDN61199.1 hypothetical protein SAMN04488053_102226 [Alkalicoccus daliensis]
MKWLLWLALIILAGCSNTASEENESESSLPLTESISQEPFWLAYQGTEIEDNKMHLYFIAAHEDETQISSGDYEFDLPAFLYDEEGIPYEVYDVTYHEDDFRGSSLSSHQLGITIEAGPPPNNTAGKQLHLPFLLVPQLYASGYEYVITEEEMEAVFQGDLALVNVTAQEQRLRFTLEDQHSAARQREIQYSFMQEKEGERIYPLFKNIEQDGPYAEVDLQFSQEFSFPVTLQIQRTTTSLPQWRLSLTVPLDKGQEE